MWPKLFLLETTFSQHLPQCFALPFHSQQHRITLSGYTPHWQLLTVRAEYKPQQPGASSISLDMTQQHRCQLAGRFQRAFHQRQDTLYTSPALTDSCCVHSGIPCICPVKTFPLPELQCWQLLWTGSWHFKCYVGPLATPFAAAKGKATLINARKSSATPPQQSGLKPPEGCRCSGHSTLQNKDKVELGEPQSQQLVLDQASQQLCTDCLKAALARSQHSLLQALAQGMTADEEHLPSPPLSNPKPAIK